MYRHSRQTDENVFFCTKLMAHPYYASINIITHTIVAHQRKAHFLHTICAFPSYRKARMTYRNGLFCMMK